MAGGLDRPEVTAQSDHTSEAKAFAFVRASLGTGSPAESARVEYWEDGLWRWFETLRREDMPCPKPVSGACT